MKRLCINLSKKTPKIKLLKQYSSSDPTDKSTDFDSNKKSSTQRDKTPENSIDSTNRAVEVKGSMRDFFRKISPSNPNDSSVKSSLWSALRVANRKLNQTQQTKSSSDKFNRRQIIPNSKGNNLNKERQKLRDNESMKNRDEIEEDGLVDIPYFEDLVTRGFEIDDSDLDGMDKFLLEVLLESMKTSEGSVLSMENTAEFNRVRLPKPRPLIELIDSTKHKISKENNETLGYEFAVNAWDAISKNYYYSDAQKHHICNKIASLTQVILANAKKYEEEVANGEEDNTSVLEDGFNKIPVKYRFDINAKRETTVEDFIGTEDAFDETDWDVEALEDEDDIFNENEADHDIVDK